jgi:hypothetical protein
MALEVVLGMAADVLVILWTIAGVALAWRAVGVYGKATSKVRELLNRISSILAEVKVR